MQEIDVYAPLVPDGSNWKATMLIEYPDENERRRELARLIGVEDRMFIEVEGHADNEQQRHDVLHSAAGVARRRGRRGIQLTYAKK